MLSFFPPGVLDEIWDLTESVCEGFPTYSFISQGRVGLGYSRSLVKPGPEVTKKNSMPNSAEHEIFPAHKC